MFVVKPDCMPPQKKFPAVVSRAPTVESVLAEAEDGCGGVAGWAGWQGGRGERSVVWEEVCYVGLCGQGGESRRVLREGGRVGREGGGDRVGAEAGWAGREQQRGRLCGR